MLKTAVVVLVLVAFSFSVVPAQALDPGKVVAAAEKAFEKASKTHSGPGPGCAVGVSLNGQTVFEKAFGLAEMEHSIPNTPQTIFESGSVAKQFTAAAVVMLAEDGKLSLDDPVRKYVPELPDYERPITIRHILTHTSGLRDWGSVMALTGAGRGDRVVTQDIALDVIVRQKRSTSLLEPSTHTRTAVTSLPRSSSNECRNRSSATSSPSAFSNRLG